MEEKGEEQMSKQEDVGIYENAAEYDHLFDEPNFEVWMEQAEIFGGPILELGCGTGKISIPMAQHGLEVVGIDLFPSMLREAQRKADELHLHVQWIEGDMRNFMLDQKFKMILLPSNNVGHLHTIDDFEACMESVKRHLLPDGVFIIDVMVPNLKFLLRPNDEIYTISEYTLPEGISTLRGRSSYDPISQIRHTETFHARPGTEEVASSIDLRMYYPQELAALLKYNGLETIPRTGEKEKTSEDEFSQQFIVTRPIC